MHQVRRRPLLPLALRLCYVQFLSPAVAVEPDQRYDVLFPKPLLTRKCRFLDVLAGTRVNLLIQYFQVGDEDGMTVDAVVYFQHERACVRVQG